MLDWKNKLLIDSIGNCSSIVLPQQAGEEDTVIGTTPKMICHVFESEEVAFSLKRILVGTFLFLKNTRHEIGGELDNPTHFQMFLTDFFTNPTFAEMQFVKDLFSTDATFTHKSF